MIAAASHIAFSLVYVSSAVVPFSPEELRALLETSRRNNQLSGITGMLLYKDGNFMQALEGDEAEVHKLHAKIAHDRRHCGLVTLIEQRIESRQFDDWSMGFRNLSDPDLQSLPGYSEFLNIPLTGAEFAADPSRAKKLLGSFKHNM